MTDLSGLPERSFVRRFAKATDMKAIDYIHALRLEEAKQMLETAICPSKRWRMKWATRMQAFSDACFAGKSD